MRRRSRSDCATGSARDPRSDWGAEPGVEFQGQPAASPSTSSKSEVASSRPDRRTRRGRVRSSPLPHAAGPSHVTVARGATGGQTPRPTTRRRPGTDPRSRPTGGQTPPPSLRNRQPGGQTPTPAAADRHLGDRPPPQGTDPRPAGQSPRPLPGPGGTDPSFPGGQTRVSGDGPRHQGTTANPPPRVLAYRSARPPAGRRTRRDRAAPDRDSHRRRAATAGTEPGRTPRFTAELIHGR